MDGRVQETSIICQNQMRESLAYWSDCEQIGPVLPVAATAKPYSAMFHLERNTINIRRHFKGSRWRLMETMVDFRHLYIRILLYWLSFLYHIGVSHIPCYLYQLIQYEIQNTTLLGKQAPLPDDEPGDNSGFTEVQKRKRQKTETKRVPFIQKNEKGCGYMLHGSPYPPNDANTFTYFFHVTNRRKADLIIEDRLRRECSKRNCDFSNPNLQGIYLHDDFQAAINYGESVLQHVKGYVVLAFKVPESILRSYKLMTFSDSHDERHIWQTFVLDNHFYNAQPEGPRYEEYHYFYGNVCGNVCEIKEGGTTRQIHNNINPEKLEIDRQHPKQYCVRDDEMLHQISAKIEAQFVSKSQEAQ